MPYYAINKGHRTGVFTGHWSEVKQHIDGYKGAKYRKFENYHDALAFSVTGVIGAKLDALKAMEAMESNTHLLDDNGQVIPGGAVYLTQDPRVECETLTTDKLATHLGKRKAPGPAEKVEKEKKTKRRRLNTNILEIKEAEKVPVPVLQVDANDRGKKNSMSNAEHCYLHECEKLGEEQATDRVVWSVVYTDGSSVGHGGPNPTAGIGLWWGPNNPRNMGEPLPNAQDPKANPKSNQRAELMAILLAMQIYDDPSFEKKTDDGKDIGLVIWTDSMYAYNCIYRWMRSWKRNNPLMTWRTQQGAQVLHQDILTGIDFLMQEYQDLLKVRYCPGHVNIHGNCEADLLAEEGRSRDIPNSVAV